MRLLKEHPRERKRACTQAITRARGERKGQRGVREEFSDLRFSKTSAFSKMCKNELPSVPQAVGGSHP